MKAVSALAIIISINLMLFLVQTSADKTGAEYLEGNSTTFFDYDDSMIGSYDTGNYTLDEDINLPSAESGVTDASDTGLITDIFNTMKSWFTDTSIGRGASYVANAVNGLPNLLKGMGLPAEFVFAVGFFWHSLTLFLFILLLTGRG